MINVLSLGAGVQSSTAALLAKHGVITPIPDAAIFADTGAEPRKVYEWLDWLESQLPFPVYRVKKGDLSVDELRVKRSKKSGRLYLKNSIPAFVLKDDGGKGLLGRKCTSDYKIVPIQKKIREITGVSRQGKGIVAAKMWIGISTDEAHRMKPSRVDYIENTFPLLDIGFSRDDCVNWMVKNGYPAPPRSACRFCPFHSDEEWHRLKTEEPEEFAMVVKFEKDLQCAAKKQEVLRGMPFLHDSMKMIGDIDFAKLHADSHRQLSMFGNECEGMCGI